LSFAAFVFACLSAVLATAGTLLWAARLRAALASTGREPRPARPRGTLTRPPRVSIHVPISNEPPRLVTATLDALARLDYPAYEVLVLDNNTSEPGLWLPVAEHCRRLGPRFRFRHLERLAGYKAGALNVCLADASRDAELVFTVDADYRLEPEALSAAVEHLRATGADFVQMPQSYHPVSEPARPLEAELGSFFSLLLPAAGPAVLPTGTLSLVRRRALEAVGGWPTRTVTEDAHLGTLLLAAGLHGVYLHRRGGTGTLPHDLRSLACQRCRWVSGNVQTLLAALRPGSARRRPPWRLWPALLLQLTAWWSALPAAALGLLIATLPPVAAAAPAWLVPLCAGWVLAEVAAPFAFFHLGLSSHPPALRLQAAGVRLALTRVSWLAGCKALLPSSRRFARTSKFADRIEGRGGLGAVLAAGFGAVAGVAGAHGAPPLVVTAFAVLAAVAALEPLLARRLRRAARAALGEPARPPLAHRPPAPASAASNTSGASALPGKRVA
jgi:cellulose synthase/poly-beta-1,6-N-acetylglucosamine synthase-like glycosyltransferase